MDVPNARVSKGRIALSILSFCTALIVATCFSVYVPFSPSDRLKMWIFIAVESCLMFSVGCIGLGGTVKSLLAGLLFATIWSFGLVMLPVPEGYGEAVYGGWAIFGMIIVILYFESKKSKKNTV